MGGWMDRQMEGRTNSQMDRQIDMTSCPLLKMQSRIYEENGCRDSQVPGHLHFSHYNINKYVSWKSSTIGQTDGRTDGPAHPPIEIKSYIKCLKVKKIVSGFLDVEINSVIKVKHERNQREFRKK